MNILDLKRKAQGFHYRESGDTYQNTGNGKFWYENQQDAFNRLSPEIQNKINRGELTASYSPDSMSIQDLFTQNGNVQKIYDLNGNFVRDQGAPSGGGFISNALGGLSNTIGNIGQGVSDAVSTDDFRKAAQAAAIAYGGYNLYNAYAGAGTAAGTGAGIVDGVGTTAANAFPTDAGGWAQVGGSPAGTSSFLDPSQIGQAALDVGGGGMPISSTGTLSAAGDFGSSLASDVGTNLFADQTAGSAISQIAGYNAAGAAGYGNTTWMDKLAGAYPGLVTAGKVVGTGLGYAKDASTLYGIYNAWNGSKNGQNLANQLSSQGMTNQGAIDDQIKGINDQISKIPTVDSLYGTDSTYAKNLMRQLAAKDAAAGRNSQYGQRLEDFNGKLATVAGDYANKYAQSVGSLNNSISSLYREKTNANTALASNAAAAQKLNGDSLVTQGQALGSLGQLYDKYKNSGISKSLMDYFSGSTDT